MMLVDGCPTKFPWRNSGSGWITWAVVVLSVASVYGETWEYTLNPGVNTISFGFEYQNGDNSPESYFSQAQGRVEWAARHNEVGAWDFYYPGGATFVNTFGVVTPGEGYVVSVSDGPPVDLVYETVTDGLALPSPRPPHLVTALDVGQPEGGWTLVGYTSTKPTDWTVLFGRERFNIVGLARYGETGVEHGVSGFTLPGSDFLAFDAGTKRWNYEDPDPGDMIEEEGFGDGVFTIQPGQAVWVRGDQVFEFGPQLEIWLESDYDGGAPNCATTGPDAWPSVDPVDEDEDIGVPDLSGNRIFNYGYTAYDYGAPGIGAYQEDSCGRAIVATQRTVRFRVKKRSVDQARPTLATEMKLVNGGTRSGTVPYSGNDGLVFAITQSPGTEWLKIEPTEGRITGDLTRATISLSVDIHGLPVGTEFGQFTVHTTAGEETIDVYLDVPPIRGFYTGVMTRWLGSPSQEDRDLSPVLIQDSVLLEVTETGATLLNPGSDFLETSLSLDGLGCTVSATCPGTDGSWTADLLGVFCACGTLSDSSNPLGVTVAREVSLEGARVGLNFDPGGGTQNHGLDLPLVGTYREFVTMPGFSVVEWSGEFTLFPAAEGSFNP